MKKLMIKMNMQKHLAASQTLGLVVASCLLIIPMISLAQTVSLKSDKTKYNLGDSFLVTASLDAAGNDINSLGGTIMIPSDRFEVSQIETGGSFMSLWVQRPELAANGIAGTTGTSSSQYRIDFSGGLPGGYSGSSGTIFTFVLKVKKAGSDEVDLDGLKAYLNDGKGTAVTSIKLIPLKIIVTNDASLPQLTYTAKIDTTPPEPFSISLSKNRSVAGNKYFVSFFAVDKGTGIAKYQVEEDPWILSWFGYKKVWDDSESPQILYYQKWISTIKVRALDTAGNVKEEKVTKFF